MCNAVFSKIAAIKLLQSDCCNQIANDDLADVKNNIYGEKSAKIPIPL